MADRLKERHPELEAAEFEAERPARELSGLPKLVVSAAAVAVSLYALYWVVAPQPAQPYRTSFLAVTLAMTLLAYRPLARGRAATDEEPEAGGDNPGPLDWALAALALVVLLYPLLVFDDFARRVVRPTGLDVVLGVVAVLLVLEATRRTKLLFDQKAALAEVHPSARRLELDTAPKVAPLELHPGARRYDDEQART
jgi:TRAP-type uncharacterized transport system fused permease subunit